MNQNRNKLIDLFIGNVINSIVHIILKAAIHDENIAKHYDKEFSVSFDIAKKYREKINPTQNPLPDKDIDEIRKTIIRNVESKLRDRIRNGYENISLHLIEPTLDKVLKKLNVI